MMAAMMTLKTLCQFKYQTLLSQSAQQSAVSVAYTRGAKVILLASALSALLLSGCQSTTTTDLIGNTPYQTSTRPSDNRNLDQQEIARVRTDRKSTRLNSSHVKISYAVFCLKKKKDKDKTYK